MINRSRLYLISIWQSTSTHEEHYTIDLSSKASLFQNAKKTIQHNSNSSSILVLTSLEEEVVPGYIQFTGHLAQGGTITHGIKWNQLMESPSMPDLCLVEPDLSLIGCNYQSGGWSDWHLNLLTEESTKNHPVEPKTCWGEREGEIPHKGCSISTLDLIWSPPSVKDLSDPVNLLHIWLISIKSAENSLIYDFGFAPLFINLLI